MSSVSDIKLIRTDFFFFFSFDKILFTRAQVKRPDYKKVLEGLIITVHRCKKVNRVHLRTRCKVQVPT